MGVELKISNLLLAIDKVSRCLQSCLLFMAAAGPCWRFSPYSLDLWCDLSRIGASVPHGKYGVGKTGTEDEVGERKMSR